MTATATKPVKLRYKNYGAPHFEPKEDYQGDKNSPEALKKYIHGEIVETTRELDKIYLNKFEKIVEQEPVPITDERRQAVSELIGRGSWKEDDRDFLLALSQDGFERIQKHASVPVIARGKDSKATSILGEDVTDDFQIAYDEGFKVWRNPAGKHQVTKQGANTKPLNTKALEASEVDKFVTAYLKETK